MNHEQELIFAVDSLRNAVSELREFLRGCKNNFKKRYTREAADYYRAKYFNRLAYVRDLREMYGIKDVKEALYRIREREIDYEVRN